jgi:hypothetical protein
VDAGFDSAELMWQVCKKQHTITYLKYIIQRFLVFSQSCVTITTINKGAFSSPQKETPFSLVVTSYFPPTFSTPSPRQPLIDFCLYRFASAGHFIWMDASNLWSFATSFFHLT